MNRFCVATMLVLSVAIGGVAAANGKKAAPHDHWMAPLEGAKRANPIKADRASLARGRELFEANCVVCHGPGGRGDGPAAKGLNPSPADLVRMGPGHSDGDFAWKIAEGRTPMPTFKGSLSEAQIWDLVNYIKRGLPIKKK